MKKVFLLLCMVFITVSSNYASTYSSCDKRTYDNGRVIVTSSGSYFEIVDNNKNVCIYIKIEEERKSDGRVLYNLMCENKVTKGLTKFALRGAILAIIPEKVTASVVGEIASGIYEEVCEYYK